MSTTADTSHADVLNIRPATLADSASVFSVLQELHAMGYAPDRASFDDSFAALVADDSSSFMLVAEDAGGALLGYALTTISPLLHTSGSSAQLQELAVADAHRGHGVGTGLMEAVERICRERNVRQLLVPSRRSADFYERLGYRSTADLLKRTFD
ncbi:MAG: GNAT family N-acetyltransferase [Rhodoglobus sp.]